MNERQMKVQHTLSTLIDAERAMFMRDYPTALYHTETALNVIKALLAEEQQNKARLLAISKQGITRQARCKPGATKQANPLDTLLNGNWAAQAQKLGGSNDR